MEIVIHGKPKEIAVLVLAVQERRDLEVGMDAKNLAQAICDRGQEAPEQLCS